jgi:hypothetical protein
MADNDNAAASSPLDEKNVNTVDNSDSDSRPSNEDHEGKESVGTDTEEVTSSGQSNEARAQNKMSILERERNEAKQALDAQHQWVLQSEERTQSYLADLGYAPEQVSQIVSNMKQQNPNLWGPQRGPQNESQNETQNEAQEIEDLVRGIEERVIGRTMQQQQAAQLNSVHSKFLESHSEFSKEALKGKSQAERNEIANYADKIGALAVTLSRTKDIKYEQALEEAYEYFSGNSPDAIEKARSEGEIEGLSQARYAESGSFQSPMSSGSTGKKKEVSLTSEERKMAEDMGVSYEAYSKNKT